jgi:hypothetical protein
VSQRVAQDNLDECRKQFEIDQRLRDHEAARLELVLQNAEKRIKIFEAQLEEDENFRSKMKDKFGYGDEHEDGSSKVELVRNYQFSWEWAWKIKRRLHELTRWEREDLEHLAKLEGMHRARERANRGEHARTIDGDQRPRTKARTRRNRPHTTRDNE